MNVSERRERNSYIICSFRTGCDYPKTKYLKKKSLSSLFLHYLCPFFLVTCPHTSAPPSFPMPLPFSKPHCFHVGFWQFFKLVYCIILPLTHAANSLYLLLQILPWLLVIIEQIKIPLLLRQNICQNITKDSRHLPHSWPYIVFKGVPIRLFLTY